MYIAVVGPGSEASPADRELAEQVGYRLALAGAVVLTGGLAGVMAAAAAGCARGGGVSVGLLPGDRRTDGSPELTVCLPTGLGELRNGLLVRCADGLVAIGGSWGTLSEIALARRAGRPVLGIGGWRLHDRDLVTETAETPAQAVTRVLQLAGARGAGQPPHGGADSFEA
ncbi:MAG TPA: dethiobiotin synthetase [Jatrophihabitans sp.]|nr:dethiobiotin synthetase [Jatrophihabitans sp.]